jgi:hypothetical protein
MRILLTVAAWGRGYAELLAHYSIASQLSPNNIPKLAESHAVTYHIVTTAADRDWLRGQPVLAELGRYCEIDWELIESHGLDPKRVPAGIDDRKYLFLSRLQNLAFAKSGDYDAIVFNYADFIWADGSLTNAIAMMRDNVDAVLSFCLPVDLASGKSALDLRQPNGQGIRNIPSRDLARIAIDHLHREAQLRFWDAKAFTAWPTYLLWPVGNEGLVVRAYHQTILVLRVDHSDPQFRQGIVRGSLDGYFTATLASDRVVHATDSDAIMVFSLYDTSIDTRLRGRDRNEALSYCLGVVIGEEQRRFAETPILIKSECTEATAWEAVARNSGFVVGNLHQTIPFDRNAHDELHGLRGNLELSLQRRSLADWFYSRIFARFVSSSAGNLVRRLLGPLARRWRMKIERWVLGDRR